MAGTRDDGNLVHDGSDEGAVQEPTLPDDPQKTSDRYG
jgi:hypothetical protein